MYFLQKTLSFFLLPLYTAFLSPSDYGIIGIVASLDGILVMLFSLSLNSAVVRFYYKHSEDKEFIKKVWGTCVTITWIMAAVITPLLIIFHSYIIDPFVNGIKFFPYIFLGIISTALNPLYMLFQRSLQARQEARKFAQNNIIYFLLNTALNIIFVAGLNLKALGMLLANAITGLIFFIVSIRYFLPQVALGIDKKAAKESLAYSLPLLPHAFAAKINGTFDRFLMNSTISTSAVGIYNVGNSLSGVISNLAGAVNQAFSPWFYQNASSGEDLNKKTKSVAYFLIDSYVVLAAGLSLFGYEIIKIMTSMKYESVLQSLYLQAFAAAFAGIYFVASNSLFLDRTRVVPFITISTATINIVLNLLLIPRFFVVGAAFSGLVTQFAQSALTIFLGQKGQAMRLNLFRVYSYAFIGLIFAVFSRYLQNTFFGFMVRGVLFLVFLSLFILNHWSVLSNLKKRSFMYKTKLRK